MNHVKEWREKRGLSKKKLSELAEVSVPYLIDLERGSRGAKPETLSRIATALNCTIDDLKGAENEQGSTRRTD